jgi:cytosine/adenosine deaminase-related metal-dependent hydrolase
VIERLNDFGLLNKDSIIVHGIFLTDKDRDIIKQNECVVALNVTSNMNNGVGITSYKKLKEKQIPVIIGNDGISSSITTEYLNLYYVNHLLEHHINGFSLNDLLDVINNTYDYVNRRLKINLGRIEVGYKADLLLHEFVHPTPVDSSNIMGHLFFGYFNAFKPSDVWVDGDHLVKDYALSRDLTKTYQESVQHAKRLWHQI